tara:strand:- start:589 stop:768 length:180 start_codon:yes stop_codon:yes gene_type:complete
MDLLWKYSITCRDSLDRKHYYITHAVDDAHAQTQFFNDRETQPGKYGDWQPGDIDLIQT